MTNYRNGNLESSKNKILRELMMIGKPIKNHKGGSYIQVYDKVWKQEKNKTQQQPT